MKRRNSDFSLQPSSFSLIAFVLIASSCERSAPPVGATPRRVAVVAANWPLAMVVRQIGGQTVNVVWGVERGGDPAGFELSDSLRADKNVADVLLAASVADTWLVGSGESPTPDRRLVRLDAGRDADAPVIERPWLDPRTVAAAVADITRRLADARPASADLYRDSAAELSAQLDQLESEVGPRRMRVAGTKVIVLDDRWQALAAFIGIRPVRAFDEPIAGALGDADKRRLRAAVEREKAAAVWVDADVAPGVADSLTVEIGVPVIRLDSLGSSTDTGVQTYPAWIRRNIEAATKIGR